MSIFRSTTATTRRLGVLLALTAVVSISLLIYYLKVVPNNKEKLHSQGFLILDQDAKGICQTVDDLRYFFRGKWNDDKAKIVDTIFKRRVPFIYQVTKEKYEKHRAQENESQKPLVCIDPDREKEALFEFDTTCGYVRYSVPLDQISKRILNTERPDVDFFTSYFIICQKHAEEHGHTGNHHKDGDNHHGGNDVESDQHIFFHSDALAVSSQLQSDTLGKMLRSIQFSKLFNLEVNGEKFRAFLLPFQLEGNSLVLAGLISEKAYQKRLQEIPFGTVWGILIAFLLILISLPFVKIFLISPSEHYGVRDLIFLGLGMFLGTALVLIMLQGMLTRHGAENRTRDELQSLSNDVHKKFRLEITGAYEELKRLDCQLEDDLDPARMHIQGSKSIQQKERPSAVSNGVRRKNLDPPKTNRKRNDASKRDDQSLLVKINQTVRDADRSVRDTYRISLVDSSYLNYSMVYWADGSGRQIFKGRMDNQPITFASVGHRQYFKDVRDGHLYSFSGRDNDINSFSIQPVYSISTNAFEVDISITSCIKKGHCLMAAMSTQMTSLMNTTFPKGYGFYIINDAGLILFQSDGEVTLRENYLDRIDKKETLLNALRNRQSNFIKVQNIDNNSYEILVRPIRDLPWHLIVYHCNNYNTTSLKHISKFASLFVIILFSVLLIYCLLAWRSVNNFSRVPQKVSQYDWLKPGQDKATFLYSANLYLFLFLIYSLICGFTVHKPFLLLFMGILLPLFAIYTLFILLRQHVLFKQGLPRATFGSLSDGHNLIWLFFLLLFNFLYFKSEEGKDTAYYLLAYEGIAMVLSGFIIGIFRLMGNNGPNLNKDALRLSYSTFWFFAVISFSLFPVQSYYQYAQQKEIELEVKASQLHFAQSIEARLLEFNWLDTISKKRTISPCERKSFLFDQGIYSIEDQLDSATCLENSAPPPRLWGRRRRAPETLNWNYALVNDLSREGSAADEQWWRLDSPKLNPAKVTLMYKLKPENNKPDSIDGANSLQIHTSLPNISSYYCIDNSETCLVIFLLSGVLLLVFFQLVRSLVARLFFMPRIRNKPISSTTDSFLYKMLMGSGYSLNKEIEKALKENNEENGSYYESLKTVWKKEHDFETKDKKDVEDFEQTILFNQQHLSGLYEEIWESCNDHEKYFLYNMAKDGFINYKNTMLLQQLVEKEILVPDKYHSLRIMSVSFRNYILEKERDVEITQLKNKFRSESSWSKIRTPALIAITAVSIFLLITQQDLLHQVAALIPTLSGLVGLGSLILGSKSATAYPK